MRKPPAQKVEEVLLVDLSPRLPRNGGEHVVLPIFARDADNRRLLNRRMSEDFLLHLERRDVLTAPAEGVLKSIDEEVIAISVAAQRVAGMKPAVAPSLRRRLR